MKHLLAMILLPCAVLASDTYLVRYYPDNGEKAAYSTDFPEASFTLNFDDDSFTGFPEYGRKQKVFSTRSDPAGKTNISEFADAKILKLDDVTDIRSKATIQAAAESNLVALCQSIGYTNRPINWLELDAIGEAITATNKLAGLELQLKVMKLYNFYRDNGGDVRKTGGKKK